MGTTQSKGDLGISIAIGELAKQGINCAIPISEQQNYDLIGEYKNTLKSIQVRYTKIAKGVLTVKLRSIWSNSQGYQVKKREKGDFDILCVYCPDTSECYFVSDNDINVGNALTLRVKKSKIKIKTVRYAEDYKDCRKCFGSV